MVGSGHKKTKIAGITTGDFCFGCTSMSAFNVFIIFCCEYVRERQLFHYGKEVADKDERVHLAMRPPRSLASVLPARMDAGAQGIRPRNRIRHSA